MSDQLVKGLLILMIRQQSCTTTQHNYRITCYNIYNAHPLLTNATYVQDTTHNTYYHCTDKSFSYNVRYNSQELLKKGWVVFSVISLTERQLWQWVLACASMASWSQCSYFGPCLVITYKTEFLKRPGWEYFNSF